jgi:hypothetical protein
VSKRLIGLGGEGAVIIKAVSNLINTACLVGNRQCISAKRKNFMGGTFVSSAKNILDALIIWKRKIGSNN